MSDSIIRTRTYLLLGDLDPSVPNGNIFALTSSLPLDFVLNPCKPTGTNILVNAQ